MAPQEEQAAHQSKFEIKIDRDTYKVTQPSMTGEELRHVPPKPIGNDLDLFEVIPGGQDQKIGDDEMVAIRNGLRFFTTPTHINPGTGRSST